ncbi:MAG: shikimate kinase [Chloroflexota bacterium]
MITAPKHTLYIVTGAPGAGKSTTIRAFIALKTTYLAFDIDWLAPAASALAQKNIYFEPATWKPYADLWFEVLHAIYKNGETPLFFSPNSPQDMTHFRVPSWCEDMQWLLLDCDDEVRRKRLALRQNWTQTRVAEALEDAQELRQSIAQHVNTGTQSPHEVAKQILAWLKRNETNQ